MSPRKRNKEHEGYPTGWRKRGSTWYYRVPKGLEHHWDDKTEYRLGATDAQAYREYARRLSLVDTLAPASTITRLAELYLAEHVSALSPKTQESYTTSIARIIKVFGEIAPTAFQPHHANTYFERVKAARSLSVARSDLTALRGLFSFGLKKGAVKAHPMTGMRFEQLPPASDTVEPWQIDSMLSIEATTRTVKVAQAYIKLKLMTGLRRGDLLRLRLSDIQDDGIHCQLHKTKKSSGIKMHFPFVDPDTGEHFQEFRQTLDEILAIPPRRIGDAYLFTTREGRGFIDQATGRADGFDTLWRRFIDSVLEHTAVETRIKEKTLRAHVANLSASDKDAQERLGHTTMTTTLKHYRRKARVVRPLKR